MGLSVVLGALVLSCWSASGRAAEPTAAKDDDYYKLMRTFVDTFEQIDRNYVKDVDRRQLMEAAIRGMVHELDQYSNYISPEELARFNQSVEQQFGGIGIQVQIDPTTRRLLVISPLPGTPAYRAGIRAGDLIMEIRGESTKGLSIDGAVRLLKGKAGEKVDVGVLHPDAKEIETISVERAIIKVSTVLGDKYEKGDTWDYMLDDEKKIGYVRLTHFSRRTNEELDATLKKLLSQGMRGLVLDLRFNPGGLLSQATRIADMFLEKGIIVSTKGRNSPERSWKASKEGTFSGFPIAVIINRYSASASEILSACLQDHKRGVVVGERSWGKGSVQNVIDLGAGEAKRSALKLTTASYHRPSGKNIHRFPNAKDSDDWGVIPNESHRLRFSNKEMEDYLKHRKQRDVLSPGEQPPDSQFKDRQLGDALAYLAKTLGDAVEKTATNDEDSKDAKKPEAKKDATASKDPGKPEADKKPEAEKKAVEEEPTPKKKEPATKKEDDEGALYLPKLRPVYEQTVAG
ncbi:MAG: peptidase S41 [Planctomycetaceae bacterium]|nr:peptidase S41 [Planctomycetaceae bacterium]